MLYTYGAVLLGMVYNFIPFMVPPIYVALEQMDKRLLDAASDLGASGGKHSGTLPCRRANPAS